MIILDCNALWGFVWYRKLQSALDARVKVQGDAAPSLTVLHRNVQCTMYNVHCTMYNVHCTMYNVQCTLYNVQCTMYTVQCTLYNVHCTMYTVQCTLYNVHCTMYNVQCTMYNVHCTMYTVQCTMYTVQCTMYNVHCTMYNIEFNKKLNSTRIAAAPIFGTLTAHAITSAGTAFLCSFCRMGQQCLLLARCSNCRRVLEKFFL